ncbi:MAG: restriction endonuclease subunit S [Bacteroidales bacterium]|nr:restriction endonuclease subunit S [Bacteroidales bacterium]
MSREMKHSGISWIGEIPKEWGKKRLKYLCSIQTGNSDTQNADDNGIYPFYVRSPYIEKSNDYSFDGEGVLMAGDGVGAGKVFHHAFGKYAVHQRVYRLAEFVNIHTDYLFYYISNLFCKVMDMGSAQSTVPSVRLPMLTNFIVCIPSFIEQQKIASFLDRKCSEIDEMVVLQEKIIEELKAYKQSVITEAVTKGLKPDVPMKDSGIEWIGEIPENWEICRIKNVCSQNTNSLSEKEDSALEFDYVDIGSVSFEKGIFNTEHYKFKDAPSRARRKACYGDLIMSTVRTYLRAIDVIDTEVKANYIYSTGFAVLTPKSHISYKFLSYISKSQYFLEQVTMLSRGINYPSINSTDLMTITILHPSLSEQQSIASYLDEKCSEIDNLISIKQSKIESLKEYKKSIIYEYVTGKKEVE